MCSSLLSPTDMARILSSAFPGGGSGGGGGSGTMSGASASGGGRSGVSSNYFDLQKINSFKNIVNFYLFFL